MTMPNDPVFKKGDLVRDFRGFPATVVSYRVVEDDSKSNRVSVEWDKSTGRYNPDKTEYYAGNFEPR